MNRVYMTKERFEEELKKGQMSHKTYEEYKASVDKVYDELENVNDEAIYDEDVDKSSSKEINASK
ncbi:MULTISPECIES: hypothetical protein [Arcobacteraceae]|uniref:Uncharacterized protein n=1 Tax=Poseidonibacter parvus TaxID=1850254 RepID=A0A1P8KNB3_9BACT|nr:MULTISPECIES: hypothetical protein [Arcobacteraceae]APW66015.1 hypothetical protein LPB137_09190 [Poseidonibacter parvus]